MRAIEIAVGAAITTGGELPCQEGRAPQGNVVILSAEDGVADTVVPHWTGSSPWAFQTACALRSRAIASAGASSRLGYGSRMPIQH